MGIYVDVIDDEGIMRKVPAPPGYAPLPKTPGVSIPRLRDLYPLERPVQTPAAYAQTMSGQHGGRVAASRKILQAQQEWQSMHNHHVPQHGTASSKIMQSHQDWDNGRRWQTPNLQGGDSHHVQGSQRQNATSYGEQSTATGRQVVRQISTRSDMPQHAQLAQLAAASNFESRSNAQQARESAPPVAMTQPAQHKDQHRSSLQSTNHQSYSESMRSSLPALKPKVLKAIGKRRLSDMAGPYVDDRPVSLPNVQSAKPLDTSAHKKSKITHQTSASTAPLNVQSAQPTAPSRQASAAQWSESPGPPVQTSSGPVHTTATDLIARIKAEVALERQNQQKSERNQDNTKNQTVQQPTQEGHRRQEARQIQQHEKTSEPQQKQEERDEIVLQDVPVLSPVLPSVEGSDVKPVQQWTQTLENPPRPYNMVPLTGGGKLKVPFIAPTGYRPSGDHELPYFCPDRDCMKRFAGARAVGGHFNARHYATKYNDNLDGTLTSLGQFGRAGDGTRSPIVVSRGHRNREPSVPGSGPASVVLKDASIGPVSPAEVPPLPTEELFVSTSNHVSPHQLETAPKAGSTPFTTPTNYHGVASAPSPTSVGQSNADAVLRSIARNHKSCKQRRDIAYLLQCPVLRELPEVWVSHHRNSKLDPVHYACAVAYMVGEEGDCQAPVHPTSRLSIGGTCIVPPSTMPDELLQIFGGPAFGTCVGCRYHAHLQRRPNKCTLRRADGKDDSMSCDLRSLSADDLVDLDVDSPGSGVTPAEVAQGDTDPWEVTRKVDTPPEDASFEVLSSEPEEFGLVSQHRVLRSRPSQAVKPPDTQEEVDIDIALDPSHAPERIPEPISSIEQLDPESWEIGPGRVATIQAPEIDVAFSSAYTAGSTPVAVRPDLRLHHFSLAEGSRCGVDPSASQLRLYTITRGKVNIITGSTELSLMGPAGAFILDPGKSCQLFNQYSQETAIICTTVEGYGG